MFGSKGGLGQTISGKIIIFTRGTITVDGIEISQSEKDRIREDSAAKLLRLLEIRKEENKRISLLKKEKEERDAAIAKKRSETEKRKVVKK